MVTALVEKGWQKFAVEPAVNIWANAARKVAETRVRDPQHRREWLTCEGTWFVGVDTLPNTPDGAVAGTGPLTGVALQAATTLYGRLPLHRAQVSVIYPGYPKPRDGEGEGAFRYRLIRDAAHVDGVLAVGDDRRRMLRERHAYILGLPLTACSDDASPLVVWEGSHHIMRAAFARVLQGIPQTDWAETDLTDVYRDARRIVFDNCPRLTLPAQPGEAYLIHRHALHGVAPWGADSVAPAAGRMIAYFRPEFLSEPNDWLHLP